MNPAPPASDNDDTVFDKPMELLKALKRLVDPKLVPKVKEVIQALKEANAQHFLEQQTIANGSPKPLE